MFEIFSKGEITKVYIGLKSKKDLDRNKRMPIGIDGVSSEIFERNLDSSLNGEIKEPRWSKSFTYSKA